MEYRELSVEIMKKVVDLYELIGSESVRDVVAINNDTISLLVALMTYIRKSKVVI